MVAFLPGSQIDTRQIIKDTKELLNKPLDLMILKMDKFRGNIVVSRKAISEVELKEQRKELLSSINEGSVIEGKVKNLTDYGAFIDLGGLDGLVHITDISWTKINSPSDILTLGQDVKVKVLKFDEELSRLSLGIKQLTENPWDKLDSDIQINNDVEAKVNSINDVGISLLIKDKYDGIVILNEMTWLKKPPHPSKLVSLNETINVKIVNIDNEKKKISCSLKQTKSNPWDKLNETIKINDILETEVVNIVDFGIFVKVHDEIDGMVHVSDLSWDEKISQQTLEQFKKGDKVKRGQHIADAGELVKTKCGGGIEHLHFHMSKKRGTDPTYWGSWRFLGKPSGWINPHLYWTGGKGRPECFDEGKTYPEGLLTLPVACY